MDLKRELESELERAKVISNDKEFISLEAVHRIINEETLEAYFRDNGHQLPAVDLKKILLEAPRLFAIHVLLDRGCDVQKYLSRGYGDKDLPFLKMPDDPEFGSPKDKASLYCGQWQIPATLVTTEHKTFPVGFKAPFAFEDSRPGGNGASGYVYKVRVADGHLPGYSSDQLLALKKIRLDPMLDHKTVMREVQTLRARKHDCIVPLIASWTAAVLESEPEVSDLNLLFPHARMDLKQWLYAREDPEEWKDRPQWQRKEYIYHSILSISSAVVFVHREIEGFISSHHDIKPANILVFGQTWKLADFGRSHLLPCTAASDTEGILGTYTYQPPEYIDSSGRKAEKRHGRAFDVWSLACIIIESLTIAVYGWDSQQLSHFRQSRIENDNRSRTKRIPPAQRGRDDSFFNNMNVVHEWKCQLLKNDGSPNLRSMLNIVTTMMFEEESHRYLSWEIHLDLYELLHPNATTEERETETRAIVQQPSAHHGKREHNPLRRAVEQKNMPRIKWLLKKGWAGHPLDLPIIGSEDSKEINTWIRYARLTKGLNWRRIVRKTIRDSPSLVANAQASGRSQEHQSPDLGSSKEISVAVEVLESSRSSTTPRKRTVEQDENGMTKIHLACRRSDFEYVCRCSEKSSQSDWDSIMAHDDSVGRVPLHYAAENGSSNIIKLLLNNFGLNPRILAQWQDHEDITPLHLASRLGHISTIELLLHASKDPFRYSKMEDKRKRTACDVARDYGHQEAYELLEQTKNPVRKRKRLATELR